jgi:hypothetical protein
VAGGDGEKIAALGATVAGDAVMAGGVGGGLGGVF